MYIEYAIQRECSHRRAVAIGSAMPVAHKCQHLSASELRGFDRGRHCISQYIYWHSPHWPLFIIMAILVASYATRELNPEYITFYWVAMQCRCIDIKKPFNFGFEILCLCVHACAHFHRCRCRFDEFDSGQPRGSPGECTASTGTAKVLCYAMPNKMLPFSVPRRRQRRALHGACVPRRHTNASHVRADTIDKSSAVGSAHRQMRGTCTTPVITAFAHKTCGRK